MTVVISFLSLSKGKSNTLLYFLIELPYLLFKSNNANSVGSPILISLPSTLSI